MSWLRVTETFTSLQGEGAHAGWPCFFVRLTGCNLRCSYCDSAYAYSGGVDMDFEEVLSLWRKSGTGLVQITGGEPLLQPAAIALMRELLNAGADVILETNGSISLQNVPERVVKVVDRKTPGSGMAQAWLPENLRFVHLKDQIKCVLTGEADYLWARDWVRSCGLSFFVQVIFSPAWGGIAPRELAHWILRDGLQVRLQLQLHKLLWGDRRGV
jgi:7-carboxy-7-deazaguanine synthase